MSIILRGGIVAVASEPKVKATVDQIIFDGESSAGRVPINAVGVLIIKFIPDLRNFKNFDVLNYWDSKHDSNAQLTIRGIIGPTKYNIQRTA